MPTAVDLQFRAHTVDGRSSRAARVMHSLSRVFVRAPLAAVPLAPVTLRLAGPVTDLIGGLLPATGIDREPLRLPNCPAEIVRPAGTTAPLTEGVLLYLHGGGWAMGGLNSHRRAVAGHSKAAGLPVVHVGYRMLPLPFTDQVEDCLDAYRWLLEQGVDPSRIVIGGESAGAFLAMATTLRAAERGLPVPAGIFGLSGVYDMDCTAKLAHPNAARDAFVPMGQLVELMRLGAGDLTSPVDSPLLGALPPVLLTVGESEVLRPDSELLADRLAAAGVACTLQIWRDQVHAFQQLYPFLPESQVSLSELNAFIRDRIGAATEHDSLTA